MPAVASLALTCHVLQDQQRRLAARLRADAVELHDVAVVGQALEQRHLLRQSFGVVLSYGRHDLSWALFKHDAICQLSARPCIAGDIGSWPLTRSRDLADQVLQLHVARGDD